MEQKIIKSEELESCLAAIKKERNVHHALLVCGNSFRKQGLYQQLEDALKKEGIIPKDQEFKDLVSVEKKQEDNKEKSNTETPKENTQKGDDSHKGE